MKLSAKKKELIFYVSVLIAFIVFFSMIGERGYYEYPDSWQYITINWGQGIMPSYPLFIHVHRLLLGEEIFLYGVVVSQTVIAIGCLMAFVIWVRRRFNPGFIVSGLIAVVSVVPLTLDFPEVLINHCILTEALAYPLFYLFVMIFTETVIRKRYGWVIFTVIMAEIMAMIRTQMQICFVFAAAVLIYIVWFNTGRRKVWKRIGILIASCVAGILLIGIAEMILLNVNGRMQAKAKEASYKIEAGAEAVEESDTQSEAQSEKKKTVASTNITGQFSSVLLDRVLYEMDEEDVLLFDDPEIRQIFQKFYEAAEASKARYVYARKGLWKWKDIMNGVAGGTYTMLDGWAAFKLENPDSELNSNWSQAGNVIAVTLLKKHWPRMLYHTLCMLPQGFICTVFFQKESIYGLCHLYTLMVYLSAGLLTFWGFKRKKIMSKQTEFLFSVLVLNSGMVIIISVIFFGMQRYLIYGFGAFYAAYLLMLEQLGKSYGSRLWKKIKNRF